MNYAMIKRFLDIVLSLTAMILLAPLLLLVAILLKLESNAPVFFCQKRVGRYKKHFTIYKFRTMKKDAPSEVPTHLLTNPHQHITPVGRILRKTSLNEIPQLLNILKGDMSIIGPRPALWNQFDLIAERDKYGANDVRPGLSGWAQINGRDTLTDQQKARYDGDYVQKMSFWFDVRCLIGTVFTVLKNVDVIEGGTGALEQNDHIHVADTKQKTA